MFFFALVAAAVACYFALAASRRLRPGVIIAAIAWLLYAAYEVMIANECAGKCNIRADVIFVWPPLWIATLFGIYPPGQWTFAGKVQRGLGLLIFAPLVALSIYIFLAKNRTTERDAQAQRCSDPVESGRECPPAAPSSGSMTKAK